MSRDKLTPTERAWAGWLGELIRTARDTQGLSRNELSRSVGCSPQQVQKLESGGSPSVGFLMVGRIASRLSLDLQHLYANFADRKESE